MFVKKNLSVVFRTCFKNNFSEIPSSLSQTAKIIHKLFKTKKKENLMICPVTNHLINQSRSSSLSLS